MNTTFERMHEKDLRGKLTCADRMIINGYLSAFYGKGMEQFLGMRRVMLKDFGRYAQKVTAEIQRHARDIAAKADRPFVPLRKTMTRARGKSKEDFAREIATRDGITKGLICVLSAVEHRGSFDVGGNHETHKLEVRHRLRPCLHFYFYFIHPVFGFMHLRLQAWFPFEIQVYVNGREWLARQLDRHGIGYVRHENALLSIEDVARAQALADRFPFQGWIRTLHALARRVNPYLAVVRKAGWGNYFWVVDQCEIATDVMWRSRARLNRVFPDLLAHATRAFSAEDVMRFLGRKLAPAFKGEVVTREQKRPEGWRIKHRMKQNWIKMYDKWSVLRIETTINRPREFRVLRVVTTKEGRRSRRWVPMGKSLANLWRYMQVGTLANLRYLEALALVQPSADAVKDLEGLCHGQTRDGRRYGRFLPLTAADHALFKATLAGDHLIHGFRNRNLVVRLHDTPAATNLEAKRRCARVSRVIAKLRAHHLVMKVKDSRLYRVTRHGYRVMSAAIRIREVDFVAALRAA